MFFVIVRRRSRGLVYYWCKRTLGIRLCSCSPLRVTATLKQARKIRTRVACGLERRERTLEAIGAPWDADASRRDEDAS